MADDETVETPQEEEAADEEEVGEDQPTASEELEAYQESAGLGDAMDGVTDSVPGAVTDLTPETSKKELRAAGSSLPAGGWAQLAEAQDVDGVEVPAGTRVQIVDTEAEIQEGITHDPYHPRIDVPEDGEIIVRTRDARGLTFGVTAEDLEPVAAGATKG